MDMLNRVRRELRELRAAWDRGVEAGAKGPLVEHLQARLVEAGEEKVRLEGELWAARQAVSHARTDVADAQGAQAQYGAKVRSLAEENARMEVQVQQLTATLELLQQLGLEACGDLDRRVDPQGLVHLHSFLHGGQVYSKAEQLQEQLTQAEETAKRSEGVRMELHARVRVLEGAVRNAINDLVPMFRGSTVEAVRNDLARALTPPTEDDPEEEEEVPDTTAGPGF